MAGMWITRLGIKGHEAKPEVQPPVVLKWDIWGSLPDDVLDRVIARMPLPTLIRMQMVCKKWRIKLRTASFIRLYESEFERPRTEWFLTFGNQKTGTVCFAYDVHLSKWHTLPLGFLPFELTNRSPLAAADGLICLGAGWNRGNMPSKLVICNPVSRSGSCSFLCINLYTNCSTVASSVVVCGWSIYRRSFLAPCAF